MAIIGEKRDKLTLEMHTVLAMNESVPGGLVLLQSPENPERGIILGPSLLCEWRMALTRTV